ncbi:hypothetical protein NL676_036896 [Syzygium grande]|nr:hypothetical protein NL676_036896 [Syzygium grande]
MHDRSSIGLLLSRTALHPQYASDLTSLGARGTMTQASLAERGRKRAQSQNPGSVLEAAHERSPATPADAVSQIDQDRRHPIVESKPVLVSEQASPHLDRVLP